MAHANLVSTATDCFCNVHVSHISLTCNIARFELSELMRPGLHGQGIEFSKSVPNLFGEWRKHAETVQVLRNTT